jgi:hypothetical protein
LAGPVAGRRRDFLLAVKGGVRRTDAERIPVVSADYFLAILTTIFIMEKMFCPGYGEDWFEYSSGFDI